MHALPAGLLPAGDEAPAFKAKQALCAQSCFEIMPRRLAALALLAAPQTPDEGCRMGTGIETIEAKMGQPS